jgi:hypothetical protein
MLCCCVWTCICPRGTDTQVRPHLGDGVHGVQGLVGVGLQRAVGVRSHLGEGGRGREGWVQQNSWCQDDICSGQLLQALLQGSSAAAL